MKLSSLCCLSLLFLLAASLSAEVTVKAVKGTVGVMAGGKLKPVAVGMGLAEDATVVTGANSEVTLEVNNGIITLKSLTTAKLRGVQVTKAASNADVALRNGTVVSEVKQITGLKTNFTVTTPVGTSSVRGTSHTVSYGPGRGMAVSVSSGVVAVSSPRGATKPVSAGNSFAQGIGSAPPTVSTQAAQSAAALSPVSGASSFAPAEELALAANLGGGDPAVADLVSQAAQVSTGGKVTLNLVFP